MILKLLFNKSLKYYMNVDYFTFCIKINEENELKRTLLNAKYS